MPQHERKHARGIRHRIRAVQNHNSVVVRQAFKHRARDEPPFLRLDVGAVEIQDRAGFDLAEALCLRRIGEDVFRAQRRDQALRRLRAGDRSACGEDHQFFHIRSHMKLFFVCAAFLLRQNKGNTRRCALPERAENIGFSALFADIAVLLVSKLESRLSLLYLFVFVFVCFSCIICT